MSIGLKIKELSVKKNITLADLAKAIGKTKQAVYEMVEKEDVNTSILRQLSSIYNVPITYFFSENDEEITIQEKLTQANNEIIRLREELSSVKSGQVKSTRVVVELDVTPDEFIKMGLKDKVIQILEK